MLCYQQHCVGGVVRMKSTDILVTQDIMEEDQRELTIIQEAFFEVTENFLKHGVPIADLKSVSLGAKCARNTPNFLVHNVFTKKLLAAILMPVLFGIFLQYSFVDYVVKKFYGTRCFIPNNYFVWEFTRPISNCEYCQGINAALILSNLTKEEFQPYAYSSRPIIIKGAASHWEASKVFNLTFFIDLYESIEGAYESVEEECQFLHFKSNFSSLREVFAMSEHRATNKLGNEPWYVGWKNCHPQVLDIMAKFYKPPHFLPEDAEIPNTNYVFLGYGQGAVMHLDYISRLMWQGQVLGNKTWIVAPTPECDHICHPFNFSVNMGDIILLDTRIWYHGTFVDNDSFSLTVTSEYG